jgi:hypothetical protein
MVKQIILYLILLNIFVVTLPAQEVVTGLQSNYIIKNAWEKQKKNKALVSADTLELPFFDDFSKQSAFPDNKKWIDNNVFINNTYSDRQITMGIATFDALDSTGRLYSNASVDEFEADHLTSRPINLELPATDNIWLSFFYQPGGLGDSPEANDSLTLQFLAPEEGKWYSVWSVHGDTNQAFRPAILKIEDSRFLRKGFQFRFINYASLSPNQSDPSMIGNCDIWNIDYVVLDKNRNAGDTIFADVAFTLPIRSLLKSHEAMPWKQFQQIYLQEMGSSILTHYRNNDTIVRNVTRNFEIRDVYANAQSDIFSAGATNINPLTNVDYKANLIYTFNTQNNDSALFRIICSLKTDEFDPKVNDTIVYYQVFKNYFAFDDGTAEAGYGINGLGSRNAMSATRFTSYMPDTLRAISICFNDSYLEANKREFDLMVWDDNNGFPGNVIYTQQQVVVEQGATINGFYTYYIPEGVGINNIFYVGWKQTSEAFLNAGLDVNTPHSDRQFYWLNGQWGQSQIQGSLMIRPITGDPLNITSVNDVNYKNRKQINIWPNPVNDYLNITGDELQSSRLSEITIMDLSGRELIKLPYSQRINIASLHEGLYIVVLSMNGRPVGYNKIIKTR